MKKLEEKKGVIYTQNRDDIDISKRVFFSAGLVVDVNDYRIATQEELIAWKEYQKKQEEEIIP